MKTENKHLKTLFSVLFFGGLWGILEATLGTLLHLPGFDNLGIFGASTAIMLPIAYAIMGACYKKTGNFRSVIYIGVVAASFKLISCAIFHLAFNPAMWIMLEALTGTVAVLLARPEKVLSLKSLGAFAVASTLYLSAFSMINFGGFNADKFVNYVVISNSVAILYALVGGSIVFGVSKLIEKKNIKIPSIDKLIASPIVPSIVATLGLTLTVVCQLF